MRTLLSAIIAIVCIQLFAQQSTLVITTQNTQALIPEGIAVDSKTKTIYVSSIVENKIIAVQEDGSHTDFIQNGDAGFGQGLGMKVDVKHNLLWAVSNKKEGKLFSAQVHVFDIATKALKRKFVLSDTISHFMNDLVLDEKGHAYLTATESGEIFKADLETGKLSLLINDTLVKYPNGIALNNDKLYIATYGNGLLLYDIQNKKLQQLTGYKTKDYAYNFDGLEFYKGNLYGVYNGTGDSNDKNGIVVYQLNTDGTKILNEQTLLIGHPLYHEPTTLSIANDKLFVLANSHLAAYNNNKESIKGIENTLTPVAIIVTALNTK